MPKLLMLKGLPGSGKSTYARELVAKGWIRVNKDDLRAMANSSKWSKANESLTISSRNHIVSMALAAGRDVVVDDTNFAVAHERTLSALAEEHKAEFSVHLVEATLEECIKRDLQRPNSVGRKVIRDMYRQFVKPIPPVAANNKHLPPAIICDIDGTLAHMAGRSPYDYTKVGEDTLDKTIAGLLMHMYYTDHTIILVSGRDASCELLTRAWLEANHVVYDFLYMRAEGDTRDDRIVKKEIYDEKIAGQYYVEFVLDDRNRVVEMWREQGLKVLQVADGDF